MAGARSGPLMPPIMMPGITVAHSENDETPADEGARRFEGLAADMSPSTGTVSAMHQGREVE